MDTRRVSCEAARVERVQVAVIGRHVGGGAVRAEHVVVVQLGQTTDGHGHQLSSATNAVQQPVAVDDQVIAVQGQFGASNSSVLEAVTSVLAPPVLVMDIQFGAAAWFQLAGGHGWIVSCLGWAASPRALRHRVTQAHAVGEVDILDAEIGQSGCDNGLSPS